MPLILAFLRSNWQYIAIAVVALGVFARYQYMSHEITSDKATITAYKTQVGQLTDANTQLSGAISKQNESIANLATIAKQQAASFDLLTTQLAKQQATTTAQVNAILNGPKPATCTDAINYLIQFGRTQ